MSLKMTKTGFKSGLDELELLAAQREGPEAVRALFSTWSAEAREVAACAYDLGQYLELEEIRSRSRAIASEGYILCMGSMVSANFAVLASPDDRTLRTTALISASIFSLWGIGKLVYSKYYSWAESQKLKLNF